MSALRKVVVLVDLQEQSYYEAARALSVPIGTVRSRLFRGRRCEAAQRRTHNAITLDLLGAATLERVRQ